MRRQVADLQVLLDEGLDDPDIEQGGRRALLQAEDPAEIEAEDEERQQELPEGPERRHRLPGVQRVSRHAVLPGVDDADGHDRDDEEHARQEPADEHVLDARLGDHAVDDDRQARREEQADAPRGGQEADRESLGIAGLLEDDRQEPAQGQDGHAGGAGERREEGADEDGHHGQPAGEPAEHGLEEPDQPLPRFALGQEEADRREERDGRDGVPGQHRCRPGWG